MFFDPYGESFLATLVITGIVAGAVTGFGITMYADYKDDGEVFNGSVNAAEYVGNTLIGGTIGGLTGAAASYITPAIGSFLSSSYILGSVAVGGECVAIAVSGAQIIGAAAVAGAAITLAVWEPGNWPGDDPTVPPGDDFVWRGPGNPGSDRGEWYNPKTGDQLHPDLNHKLPKGPHWGWRNKLKNIFKDIFKP